MSGHCPHLGLDGDRGRVSPVPGPSHRCYFEGRPERVPVWHQAAACLTPAHPGCPRLVPAVPAASPPARTGAPSIVIVPPAAGQPAASQPVGNDAPSIITELRTAAQPRSNRRPVSSVEVVVGGLLVSIVLAGLFVAYVVWYRLQVGPGMSAAPVAAVQAGASPEARPSLVPTFTATPLPRATAVPVAGAPPTAIPEPTLPLAGVVVRPPAQSPPTRLVIPAIELDIPVMPVTVKTIQEGGQSRQVWADLPRAGAFHATSAYPGSGGNTVINGHRDIQGAVFRHLDRVEVGDEIVLYVGAAAYPYRVAETLVVPETFASASQRAENLRLIGPLPEERLTLITCTPVGLATHRLLVIARPAESIPTPTAGP